jgi:Ca2+-transporting ATPase
MAENWHALAPADALNKLGSRSSGLTESEVKKRQADYGPNSLEEKAGESAFMVFLSQFASPLV